MIGPYYVENCTLAEMIGCSVYPACIFCSSQVAWHLKSWSHHLSWRVLAQQPQGYRIEMGKEILEGAGNPQAQVIPTEVLSFYCASKFILGNLESRCFPKTVMPAPQLWGLWMSSICVPLWQSNFGDVQAIIAQLINIGRKWLPKLYSASVRPPAC